MCPLLAAKESVFFERGALRLAVATDARSLAFPSPPFPSLLPFFLPTATTLSALHYATCSVSTAAMNWWRNAKRASLPAKGEDEEEGRTHGERMVVVEAGMGGSRSTQAPGVPCPGGGWSAWAWS